MSYVAEIIRVDGTRVRVDSNNPFQGPRFKLYNPHRFEGFLVGSRTAKLRFPRSGTRYYWVPYLGFRPAKVNLGFMNSY